MNRMIHTAFAAALSISMMTVNIHAATVFTDVPANAYYAKPVEWAVNKGITAGTSATTFSPDATCTNAQILTFLWKSKGSQEPTISNPFSNITTSAYYYKAALWAYQNGLVDGSVFEADTPCTRSSTVLYLWKLAGKPTTEITGKFTDVSSNAPYTQAVSWAVKNGITSGTGENTFSPDKTCTRAQIVTFLLNDDNRINGQTKPAETPTQTGVESVTKAQLDALAKAAMDRFEGSEYLYDGLPDENGNYSMYETALHIIENPDCGFTVEITDDGVLFIGY